MIAGLGCTLALALALGAAPSSAKAPRPQPEQPAKVEDAKPAPPPLSQEDAAVVENLELLQRMELLDDLPVVDPGDDEGDDEDPPPPPPARIERRR
jgi:hypothetical protein